jgi:ribosomal protein L37E
MADNVTQETFEMECKRCGNEFIVGFVGTSHKNRIFQAIAYRLENVCSRCDGTTTVQSVIKSHLEQAMFPKRMRSYDYKPKGQDRRTGYERALDRYGAK